MNVPGTTGESSSKRQENGDSTMDSERPLKKARFAWQVKGKYHLKNELTENAKTLSAVPNENNEVGSSSYENSESNDTIDSTEENLEILGDYLLKQDFNTLDSVITDSCKPSTSVSKEKPSYPRYISTYENNMKAVRKSANQNASAPISMVFSQSNIENQCIERWQASQMAQGCIDNTVNQVLENWLAPRRPGVTDENRALAFDVAQYINNLPSDDSIENEGILMAISAHGLQNTRNSQNTSRGRKHTSNTKDTSISPTSKVLPSNENITHERSNNKKFKIPERASSNEFDMSWAYSDDLRGNNDLSFFPDSSNSSDQCFSESNHRQIPANDYEVNENLIGNDHCEFVDAAINFAILSKGLTLGSDYG